MGKLLGIDYGTKRIGLALSDEGGKLAFPHSTVENGDMLLVRIGKVVEEESVDTIVLGESIDYKRRDNPLMKDIRVFETALKKRFHLPIHFEPEWLTSFEARRTAQTSKHVDASAAALILQTYLDKQRGKDNF